MRPGSVIAVLCFGSVLAAPASLAQNTSHVPDFSGSWGRNAFDLEAVPSGPSPVTNLQRLPGGTGDPQRPIADYRNRLLKPEAAEIVRLRSELSRAGKVFPDPSNQCAPFPPPFVFGMQLGVQIFQGKDEVLFLYNQDSQVRRVRLNAAHPAHLTPSWKGDSVGHYEGDTLVIDTIGIKTGPVAVIDRYGTPFSKALHVVERYRLIDAKDAAAAQARHEKEAGRVGGEPGVMPVDTAYGKGLQLALTIEDPGTLTAPLPALVTYRRTSAEWQELPCAENTTEYYAGKETAIPTADKPDF
jgi:hypothetical protein